MGAYLVLLVVVALAHHVLKAPLLRAPVVAAGLLVVIKIANGWVRWSHVRRQRQNRLNYGPEQLDALSGAEFEGWVLLVLRSAGFQARDTQASGDFGVDVIAECDGVRFGIQAKKRTGRNVGNAAVQEANAGADYYECDVAAVVTQSGFTRAARAQAERLSRPCLLVGREDLTNLATEIQRCATQVIEVAAAQDGPR